MAQVAQVAQMALPSGPALEVEIQPHVVVEQGCPNILVTLSSLASELGDGENESSLYTGSHNQPGARVMASKGALQEMGS